MSAWTEADDAALRQLLEELREKEITEEEFVRNMVALFCEKEYASLQLARKNLTFLNSKANVLLSAIHELDSEAHEEQKLLKRDLNAQALFSGEGKP